MMLNSGTMSARSSGKGLGVVGVRPYGQQHSLQCLWSSFAMLGVPVVDPASYHR